MADQSFEFDVLRDLLLEAGVVGQLAADQKAFQSTYAAFRAGDKKTFQADLARLKLVPRCELVCEWIRIKECVFLCLELCGPPKADAKPPDPHVLADAIVRVTSNPKLVQQLAQIVEKRDRAGFQRFVDAQKLGPFCHFFCHWVCLLRWRLVCRWICDPRVQEQPNLAAELSAAGHALRVLLGNRPAFDQAVAGAQAGDPAKVGAALDSVGLLPYCRLICEWFCSWRCVLVCFTLCRQFPLPAITDEIAEAYDFAKATQALGKQPLQLERLSAAVGAGDVKTFNAIVTELKLQRFCIQLCHWLCFIRCRRYCILVCPPRTEAVFTKIGQLYYNTDIGSHPGQNGLTVTDHRAFYNTLRLNGGLSVVDGAPLVEYRFETVSTSADGTTLSGGGPILPGPTPTGSWVPVLPAQIAPTNIGTFMRSIAVFPFFEEIEVWVNKSGPGIFTITPSADGWIQIPPMFPAPPMVPAEPPPAWRFFPGGDLLQLITESLLPPFIASVDETGVVAGSSANAPLQTDVYFGIRMRLRNVGATSDGSEGGTCEHIAINNTRYNNISHHPYWPGGLFGDTNELAVSSVGIAELAAAPCATLHKSLTVEFTAAHSNMGGVSAWLEGPGGPFAFDLSPAAPQVAGESWFGTATPSGWTFASLAPCAYLLKLGVEVLLTTGDPGSNTGTLVDYIAFCKGA
jgi:hypothetical protein